MPKSVSLACTRSGELGFAGDSTCSTVAAEDGPGGEDSLEEVCGERQFAATAETRMFQRF